MTVQVSSCLFGVNEVKVKKKKIIYHIVLERAQGPTLLDCNYADTCFTVALGSVLAGCYTQVPQRSTLYQQSSGHRTRHHNQRNGVPTTKRGQFPYTPSWCGRGNHQIESLRLNYRCKCRFCTSTAQDSPTHSFQLCLTPMFPSRGLRALVSCSCTCRCVPSLTMSAMASLASSSLTSSALAELAIATGCSSHGKQREGSGEH